MNEKGFTLIEMLVVIAIIGLLSSVVVIGLTGAREKARDSRRVADLRQIQNALEVNYSSADGYADALSDLSGIPTTDPQGVEYDYETSTSTFGYYLGICMETTDITSEVDCPTSFPTTCSGNEFCITNQ